MSDYGWNQEMSMGLLEKLKSDLKTAMKSKDTEVRDTIRQVISEFPKLTVPLTLESGKKSSRLKKDDEITNDDIVSIIMGLVKSEKTVMELKKEETSSYLDILSLYMPKMADRASILAWINDNIDFANFKSPMQAMGPVMKNFGKTADGNLVKQVLAELAKK